MSNNELLDAKIKSDIKEVRYTEPKKKDRRKSIFYLVLVTLITLVIIFSLLRRLF